LVEYRLKTIFERYREQGSEGRPKAAREAVEVLAEVPPVRRAELLRWAAHEWAGDDVKSAPFLQRLLLREVESRAAEKAGTGRDDWQSLLVARGLPRPLAQPGRRWLSTREWATQRAEQMRRLAPLREAASVSQLGGNPPDSVGSPVYTGFIGETVARAATPVLRNALRLERRILMALLRRPELAGIVFGQMRPDEMLLPIHQEIAEAAGAPGAEGGAGLGALTDRLAQDEEVFAAAVEIAVEEEDYDTDNLERDIARIREARFLAGDVGRTYRVNDEPVQPAGESESLAEIERQVQERLAAGSLTADDPIYQRYMSVRRHLHGIGELPPWDFG
jgi:hypothetical protein